LLNAYFPLTFAQYRRGEVGRYSLLDEKEKDNPLTEAEARELMENLERTARAVSFLFRVVALV
jgi:hypothetical protein